MFDSADPGAGPRGGGSAFCCSCPELRAAPSAGGDVFVSHGLQGPSSRLGMGWASPLQPGIGLSWKRRHHSKKLHDPFLSKSCSFHQPINHFSWLTWHELPRSFRPGLWAPHGSLIRASSLHLPHPSSDVQHAGCLLHHLMHARHGS